MSVSHLFAAGPFFQSVRRVIEMGQEVGEAVSGGRGGVDLFREDGTQGSEVWTGETLGELRRTRTPC